MFVRNIAPARRDGSLPGLSRQTCAYVPEAHFELPGQLRLRDRSLPEVWRPGEPSLVIPLACKGNHSNSAISAEQLASASAHAEAVHIGPWNEVQNDAPTPRLPAPMAHSADG